MTDQTQDLPDRHQYRVDLCAYEFLRCKFPRGTKYYQFIADSDQDAERKVGTIGSRELEVLKDGVWQAVH